MNILLISGGHIDENFCINFVSENHFDKIIAVDGGLEVAHRLNLCSVTDIVGDFDTVSTEILKKYLTGGPKIHRFNPEKDYTDTDIALKLAMEYCSNDETGQCVGEIWILGATGSRLDHVLANITMLLLPFRNGIRAWIIDTNNRISLVSGRNVIEKKKSFGKYLSLIPLTAEISGVTMTGVKYPLKNHTVHVGESLCVSNEITEDQAVIEIKDGIAVMLETKD